MTQENNLPQDAELTEPVGAEESQKVESTDKQPGAEEKPRTYTQEEWSKRESAKDTETAGLKEHVAQLTMQAEIVKMQQTESTAKTKDQKDVDEGSLTTLEATQREQVRIAQRQNQLTSIQQAGQLRQMTQQIEQGSKVLAAQDFGKQYELTQEQITELLADKDVKTPGDMKAKAADLALERVRGEAKKPTEKPKFDKGQSGGEEQSYADSLKERFPAMHKKQGGH